MARRLLIDLWRYLEYGLMPEGARIRPVITIKPWGEEDKEGLDVSNATFIKGARTTAGCS